MLQANTTGSKELVSESDQNTRIQKYKITQYNTVLTTLYRTCGKSDEGYVTWQSPVSFIVSTVLMIKPPA